VGGPAVPTSAPVAVPMPTKAPVTLAPTSAFPAILIACGRTDSYTDVEGQVWAADDKWFNGGNAYFAPWLAIDETEGTSCYVGAPSAIEFGRTTNESLSFGTDDTLYQGERYGVFDYKIPVPPGKKEPADVCSCNIHPSTYFFPFLLFCTFR
jgi:Malectin domain